jgi:outer membrane receptor protein involved in Fe transport
MRPPSVRAVIFTLVVIGVSQPAASQPAASQPAATQPAATQPAGPTSAATFRVTVVGTTPLPGVEVAMDWLPAPVQIVTSQEIEQSQALDVSSFLIRRVNGVYVNEVQNNPFQPDVNYRGYTASPLLGTPQGISVYMDGVRLNQPFGEVVSWDLLPRIALANAALMPGSNPLFGLNTLGGALSLQTKDGRTAPGTTVQAFGGASARRAVEIEHGGRNAADTLNWYLAGSLFSEDGWRDDSPSDVRQIFGKIGWQRDANALTVSLAHANNSLTGNGLQDFQLLEGDYDSVYTKPDTTDNRATLLTVNARRRLTNTLSLSANAYFRHLRTNTLNGDINEEALEESVYQPGAAERAALAAAGYGQIPSSGLDASNTPFPFLRCVGNVLLNDEPAEKCNGLINRSETGQHNGGFQGQISGRGNIGSRAHLFTAGAAFDRSSVAFEQSTELGYLNPDRGVTGTGAFGDGETGGDIDGEPFDTRVNLDGTVTTFSLFATDTLPLGERVHLTVSGRFNRTVIDNRDQLQPGGGPGSLDGKHTYSRFNPAAGVTVDLSPASTLYAGYSEGSRAATSIELGCADPEEPCKLPNAMAGDPPLDQVVTRTVEAGVRGTRGGLEWNAGVFRARNRDDILFVTSEQTGFGYFKNFGQTRRQGVELSAKRRFGDAGSGAGASAGATIGIGYTFLRATFESEESVNGESNSTNEEALEGEPGMEGTIEIEPGDRMPLVPQHLLKVFADVPVTERLDLSIELLGAGGVYARGNENNDHEADGVYYLGDGRTDGYAIVTLAGSYELRPWLHVIGQVNNLFDRDYATGAQLGPAGFTSTGNFIARPFPAVNGEFPGRHTTFLAPGAPLRAWAGVRMHF